ncbi:MAG: hypothetical protein FJ242_00160 [Nitrospira sp.]|nr:hypothetical protein [Nitrospira sp.]
MKKVVVFIIALLFFSQVGCTKSIRYSEEEIKGFSPAIQEHIKSGEVVLGMIPQQVRYAWGSPDSLKILEPFEGKTREEWIYSTLGVVETKLLLFFDGKLIYMK